MICFQKFFLQYLSQQAKYGEEYQKRCDLLSKVLFTIFVTALAEHTTNRLRLWFAFKSSFYNICHSYPTEGHRSQSVVICFQKFFLQYLSQQISWMTVCRGCCDLLSKVLFTIFVTAFNHLRAIGFKLWFAFKSSFYNICHSLESDQSSNSRVVICFQKFFLQYLSQLIILNVYQEYSCDLLSKVLFTIFVTANMIKYKDKVWLWFAFKSSFYNICHSANTLFSAYTPVVICFQKFFLQYLSQRKNRTRIYSYSCDLLSKVLFTIFVTAKQLMSISVWWLWFAFKSSFYNICHSMMGKYMSLSQLWFAFKSSFYNICHSCQNGLYAAWCVVICFQKFFLQYLSQLLWLIQRLNLVVICFQKFFLQYLSQQSTQTIL